MRRRGCGCAKRTSDISLSNINDDIREVVTVRTKFVLIILIVHHCSDTGSVWIRPGFKSAKSPQAEGHAHQTMSSPSSSFSRSQMRTAGRAKSATISLSGSSAAQANTIDESSSSSNARGSSTTRIPDSSRTDLSTLVYVGSWEKQAMSSLPSLPLTQSRRVRSSACWNAEWLVILSWSPNDIGPQASPTTFRISCALACEVRIDLSCLHMAPPSQDSMLRMKYSLTRCRSCASWRTTGSFVTLFLGLVQCVICRQQYASWSLIMPDWRCVAQKYLINGS
jgi:hypothetical protein